MQDVLCKRILCIFRFIECVSLINGMAEIKSVRIIIKFRKGFQKYKISCNHCFDISRPLQHQNEAVRLNVLCTKLNHFVVFQWFPPFLAFDPLNETVSSISLHHRLKPL